MDPTAGSTASPVGVGSGSPYQVDGWSLGSRMMDLDTNTVVMNQGNTVPSPSTVPAGTLFSPFPTDFESLLSTLNTDIPLDTSPPDTPLLTPPAPPPQPTPVTTARRSRRRVPRRRPGVGTSSSTTTTNSRTQRRPRTSPILPNFASTDEDEPNQRQTQMQRQLALLQEDARQQNAGRRIRNITRTDTITTVYEEDPNGTPSVRRTSTRTGAGRRTRVSRSV